MWANPTHCCRSLPFVKLSNVNNTRALYLIMQRNVSLFHCGPHEGNLDFFFFWHHEDILWHECKSSCANWMFSKRWFILKWIQRFCFGHVNKVARSGTFLVSFFNKLHMKWIKRSNCWNACKGGWGGGRFPDSAVSSLWLRGFTVVSWGGGFPTDCCSTSILSLKWANAGRLSGGPLPLGAPLGNFPHENQESF